MDTRVLTAHVPTSLADQVDTMAARLERSRGWIIKQALAEWLEQEEKRHQWTLEALANVESGDVIDHDDVENWAASLGTATPKPIPTR